MKNIYTSIFRKTAATIVAMVMIMLFSVNLEVKAQNVSTYCFSQTSGPYNAISGTAFTLAGGTTDDGYSALTSIGFNFVYHGITFTQISANTNGFVQLGVLASSTTTYIPLSSLPNCIAICAGNGKLFGAPVWALTGTAPNRVFTIQFTNYYVDNLSISSTLPMQLKLSETSNTIQICYGAGAAVDHLRKQVGLTGATVADFNCRKTTISWAATITGTSNADTLTYSSTVYPANGQTYTWTPPVAITTQPSTASQILCPIGAATALTISASATNYQWYSNTVASNTGGTLISGATSSSYTPSTATIGTLYYYCVVSNSCGSSLSSSVSGAIVVANPPNPISVTATPSTICNGSSTNLNATATGYSINWFTVPTGGTSIGTSISGANYAVSPTATTTYYAEAEGNNFTSTTISYTGSIVTWTVPAGVTSLTITAKGAQGGQYSAAAPGGLGASVQGTFAVTGGQVLSLLVGQQPATACSCMPGGGGGTFVGLGAAFATATPMICAGGGGGSYTNGAGQGGQITNVTTTGDGGGPVPGTNGNGAASTTCGGGGGGFYTSGGNDTYQPTYGGGGQGFRQGGAGGTSLSYGAGGFGGGATADYYGSCYTEAGAGGGYSGGSGMNSYATLASGYGGGSYNSGTSQTNTAATNSGNGQVVIAYFTPSCASPARVPVTVTVIPGPVFSVQPATATQTLCYNGAPTPLTVAASPATSYQWYSNATASNTGGTLIPGATNTTYTPLTTTAGTLYYYCVATSGCSFPSNVSGAIAVYPANGTPVLSGGSPSICSGASPGTLSAAGSGGNGTFTYLWYLDGVSTGITTQTYNPGSLTANASIYCAVTSCGATQNSVTFNAVIISAPLIVTATPPTICPGSSTNLSAIEPGATITWYTVPTGGTLLGTSPSGGNFVVSPVSPTTYYAEASQPASTIYNFTTCTATDTVGPTQAMVNTAYTSTTLAGAVTVLGKGIQQWTVPATGSYTFTVKGASGGTSTTYSGYGAQVNGTVMLNAGTILNILVGQVGSSHATSNSDGGGGGSFVAQGASYTTATPLFVAGGGGGAAQTIVAGQNASTTTAVVSSAIQQFGSNGAGFSTPGVNFTYGTYNPVAKSFTNGGNGQMGGQAGGWPGAGYGDGGFGGGGASCSCSTGGGGGGGGYVGGGGGGGSYTSGYGGSSYIDATATSTSATVLSTLGNGSVTVTYVGGGCVSPTRTPVTVNMATPAVYSLQPSLLTQSICLGAPSTALSVAAAPVTGYQWYSNTVASNTGGTLIPGATNPTYTPLTTIAGTKYYYCAAIDSGCALPSTVSGAVNVYSIPTAGLLANHDTICSGSSATITASGGGSYLWSTGLTTPIITVSPAVTTAYTVTVTVTGCTATAIITIHVQTCTGISDYNSTTNFDLYPNPANTTITIENTSSNTITAATLTIYNIEGQLLLTQPMLKPKMDIDISQLARGMYYMVLTSENGKGVRKFIKD